MGVVDREGETSLIDQAVCDAGLNGVWKTNRRKYLVDSWGSLSINRVKIISQKNKSKAGF